MKAKNQETTMCRQLFKSIKQTNEIFSFKNCFSYFLGTKENKQEFKSQQKNKCKQIQKTLIEFNNNGKRFFGFVKKPKKNEKTFFHSVIFLFKIKFQLKSKIKKYEYFFPGHKSGFPNQQNQKRKFFLNKF